MTKAIVFGLAALALGFMIRDVQAAQAQEVTARDADGQRPATRHEIRSFLEDAASLLDDITLVQQAIVPDLFCRETRPYSPQEIAQMIRCSTRRFGGDPQHLIAMGACESGLRADARGGSGGNYRGVFQYAASTWANAAGLYWKPAWGRRHVEIPGIYNGRAQVIVTTRYTNANGFGPWSCA